MSENVMSVVEQLCCSQKLLRDKGLLNLKIGLNDYSTDAFTVLFKDLSDIIDDPQTLVYDYFVT